MNKGLYSILFFLAFTFSALVSHSTVTVTGSTGANGSYTTLKEAFDSLNAHGDQTSNTIIIRISTTTTETATATLNQPSIASWASLTILPAGVAMVTGNLAAPLISLNGADSVTIDGLNNLIGDMLTIENTSTATTAGTSTIRFINDASNNKIINCTINGSSKTTETVAGGTILFSTASATGNDNNYISNCRIGPAGSNLPSKGIHSLGSASMPNDNTLVTDCYIYDFFNASDNSYGIYLGGGNSGWTLDHTRFYQTAPRVFTVILNQHVPIRINTTSGNDFKVFENIIGFADSTANGVYSVTGSSNKFFGIYLTVGNTTASSIQANMISGINHATTSSGSATQTPCAMIYADNGTVNIGDVQGNEVGSQDGSSGVSFSTSSIATAEAYGIFYANSFNNVVIANNKVGSITVNATGSGSPVLIGIGVNGAFTQSNSVNNNIVGGDGLSGALANNCANTSSRVIGIRVANSKNSITNNTVHNLKMSAPNTSTVANASVIGIHNSGSYNPTTVSGNKIYDITNRNDSTAVNVIGLLFGGAASGVNIVSENFIHSVVNASSVDTSSITGIYVSSGATSFYNNMVRLGIDTAGSSMANNTQITGILNNSGANTFYFNSVFIGGSGVVSDTANTAAFNSKVVSGTRTYENNIFSNARSNASGNAKHYAVVLSDASFKPSGIVIGNNDYYVSGTGPLGHYGTIDAANVTAWTALCGADTNIYNVDPMFNNPTGNSAAVDLHINSGTTPTPLESGAVAITGITTDIDGDVRPGPAGSINGGATAPDVGADEFDGIPFTTGVTTIAQAKNSFSVYPNPTTGLVKISLPDNYSEAVLSVTDVTGRVVYSTRLSSKTTTLDLSFLSAGIYQLNIAGKNDLRVQRLVIGQ